MAELKEGQEFESLEGTIVSLSEIRSVEIKDTGKRINVRDAMFKSDELGMTVPLSLWGENTKAFRAGDRIKATKVIVKKYRETLSLSTAPIRMGGNIELVR